MTVIGNDIRHDGARQLGNSPLIPSDMNGSKHFFALMLLVLPTMVGCSLGSYGPPAPAEDAETEFTTTESGLRYRILRKSDGKKARPDSSVKAHYHGTLDDGTIFDSSYGRGEPSIFNLRRVVKGWSEGIPKVGEGGMIELDIPAELGYGEDGQPPVIPPNARLHFVVEVIRVF